MVYNPDTHKVFSGEKLLDLRQARGVKRIRVAADLDLSEGTVRDHETGAGVPTANTVGKYAMYFNVPVDALYICVDNDGQRVS